MLPALPGRSADSVQRTSEIPSCSTCDACLRRRQNARAPQQNTFSRYVNGRHEKNANASSVAISDAIAVTNAEVHADFK
jgi:hypothetical protein